MSSSRRGLRVAVVGAGPAGIYAAESLTAQAACPVSVDVIDRLPTPFGLVRNGVAPDHVSIRGARRTLEKVLRRPGVRFLGNVEVGRDVSVAELHHYFDAVIFAYGASGDRRLGVAGEDLSGSLAATDLVAWYCGHPDAVADPIVTSLRHARSVIVVGMGNVAVDVTRVLAKSAAELQQTEMPQHVLDALASSTVTDIHVLGRRGPAQASFTTKELRELGELAEADVFVSGQDLVLDSVSEQAVAADRLLARNVEVLREWSQRRPSGRGRRIHMHFFTRPLELIGAGLVSGVRVERTRIDEASGLVGTGETRVLPAQMVIRSVGYRGEPIGGLGFDPHRGVVPNERGRVVGADRGWAGEYVAGWIKRGPSGVIGTNKKDAAETVASLLADAATLPLAAEPDPEAFTALLSGRHVEPVDLDGWLLIDEAETVLGRSYGRERTLLHQREELLRAAAGGAARSSR